MITIHPHFGDEIYNNSKGRYCAQEGLGISLSRSLVTPPPPPPRLVSDTVVYHFIKWQSTHHEVTENKIKYILGADVKK